MGVPLIIRHVSYGEQACGSGIQTPKYYTWTHALYSARRNCAMLRNLLYRDATNSSVDIFVSSLKCFCSASSSNVAAVSWSVWAPPLGSGTMPSIQPNSSKSTAVMRSACAASSFLVESRHIMAAQDLGG